MRVLNLLLLLMLSAPLYFGTQALAKPCGEEVLEAVFAGKQLVTVPFPKSKADIEVLMKRLDDSVYAPVVEEWRKRGTTLSFEEKEKLWRMNVKHDWRMTDAAGSELAEKRIKMLTQRERRAFQWGGPDENADPAAPFVMMRGDPRPKGMPLGSYSLSSGKTGYIYKSTDGMLKNEVPVPFEIEFQQVTHDGKIVVQKGGYAAPDGSWGWDGRFEIQPDGKGGHEIIMTQGAMELPVNLKGAAADAPLSPQVSEDNVFRARHSFELKQWIPAKNGAPAKLVVRDQGTILGFTPSTEKRWIQVDEAGALQHAHGYGESYIPDSTDPRKMWVDEEGYTWRVFDMVTKETTIEDRLADGTIHRRYIPTETRSVAARMDKNNPSKRAEGMGFKFLTTNRYPGTDKPMPGAIRYLFDTRGNAVEQRIIQEDGTVKIVTENVPQNEPALLFEGLNFAEKPITVGKKTYYLATDSGGEYTSGGPPTKDQKFYGTYLWYREAGEGRIGEYHPVMTEDGKDAKDMFREITQMYGGSWGIGRAQLVDGGKNGLWTKAHMVDVDLLPNDPHRFPLEGYPPEGDVFANAYRRHQIEIPTEVVIVNGKPTLQVADPRVREDIKRWKARLAKHAKD